MTNVIQFPRTGIAPVAPAEKPLTSNFQVRDVWRAVVKGVWVLVVLLWPILKWIVSIDCLFQFVRMVYHWDSPGMYAGWTFILHFGVLTALTYFVSGFRPKDIR